MTTIGTLKVRILQRLKLLHEQNPDLGIIPHPAQAKLYEELFRANMCRLVARTLTIGEPSNLDDPSHRRSFHFIDSDVGYTQEQLAAKIARLEHEAKHQNVNAPPDPFQLAEHERQRRSPAVQK